MADMFSSSDENIIGIFDGDDDEIDADQSGDIGFDHSSSLLKEFILVFRTLSIL